MSEARDAAGSLLRVAVVTPEGAAFDGEARSVVVPGMEGEVAFWPLHAAYVGAMGMGELRITRPGGEVERWMLEGGVAEVAGSRVTVLADRVLPLARIDVAATRAELE
ncbi:MAG: FoF1 ATP synthase subunit delta/epsilon, partial [Planctomycetia bacterium]